MYKIKTESFQIQIQISYKWIYEINNIKNERSGRCRFGSGPHLRDMLIRVQPTL